MGGNIVSVYSLLYSYWKGKGGEPCEINVNQIKNIYSTSRTAKDTEAYRDMLGKFSAANLIEYTTMTKTIAGTPYTSYLIKNVRTELPEATKNINVGEDDTSDIYKTLGTNTIDIVAIEKDKK